MENSTENINPGRPVYFSYARNSSRKPEWEHISDCVETLLETMTANNLEYRVDVKDIGMGDKISKFEQEIGWNSEVVVIIFSDKYFRSMHCMYEFVQIKNALKQYPQKRLMCIKSGDFNLADINYIMELEDYWNDQKKEYDKIEYHRLREHSGTEKAAWQNGFYIEDIRKLYSFFSAINYSNATSINYESFVGDIVKYYKTTPKPDRTPKPPKYNRQPQTHTANTRIVQPQTYTDQPRTQQQLVQTVQQTVITSQPETKKILIIIPIVVATMVVGALTFFWLVGNDTTDDTPDNTDNNSNVTTLVTTTEQTYTPDNTDNNGDGATLVTTTDNNTTNIEDSNTFTEDDNAIFDKAYSLFNAGNYSEAVVYYEKLANKGNITAQFNAGLGYTKLGNYENAVYWYQKAAGQGNAGAQKNLGDSYYFGNGVTQNYGKAVEWYQKAAEQGNAFAQYSLGYCYLYGQGVTKDIRKAKEWLQKAADQGNEDAIKELKDL